MERREAARWGGKVMSTGGKNGQKLEKRNGKPVNGNVGGAVGRAAVHHIIKIQKRKVR